MKDINKNYSFSIWQLSQCRKAYNDLESQYVKALEFIKWHAELSKSDNDLLALQDAGYDKHIAVDARKVLRAMREL